MRKRRMAQESLQVDVIPRACWGAPSASGPPAMGRVEAALIHHTATEWDAGPAPVALRSICELHRERRGWSDIGYNLLIGADGAVYEGRAGGVERAVVGAHARGWNGRTTGIALIGSYEQEPPAAPALEALARVLAWKLALHGIRPGDETVLGHRDVDETSVCPGDALQASLPAVRRRAAEIAAVV
jgi:hypothetical protein